MKKHILAYLAGVMDSDGSIGIRKDTYQMRVRRDQSVPSYYPRICVGQITPQAIALFKQTFGGIVCVSHRRKQNRHPLLRWEMRHKRATAVVQALLPFMRIKRKQAMLVIRLTKLQENPRMRPTKVRSLTRWGRPADFMRLRRSPSFMNRLERLYLKMRSLNDTRFDPQFWPITDRQRTTLNNRGKIEKEKKSRAHS